MRRTITRSWLVGVALGASLMLAACSSGDDGGSGDTGGDTASGGDVATTVTMVDNAYEPSDPLVTAGDLELVNAGEATHTFTIEDQDVDVEVGAGESGTATIDLDPGSYTLFCRFHRSAGLDPTLTVE